MTKITEWLDFVIKEPFTLTPLPGDASKRFYFRVTTENKQVVAVDATEEKQMNELFVSLARPLYAHGVNVPEIIEADPKQGYLLITDFGDKLYQSVLAAENATTLYQDAFRELIKFQSCTPSIFPLYTHQQFINEANLFREWYLQKHLKNLLSPTTHRIFDETVQLLAQSAIEQPQVPVHRDYHSRNLFWLAKNNPGIIDFQDAVFGPITYDVVSLLKDCYIDWPAELVNLWLRNFFEQIKTGSSFEQFEQWFDWMGLQRHLKAVGIFARLYERDGLKTHLPSIPRTMNYIEQVIGKYSEFREFNELLKSLPASLFKREEQSPPLKKGGEGGFCI